MELPKHLVIAWSKLFPELKNRGIFSTSRHADASIRISYSIYPETHIDISLNTFLGQRGTAWDSVGQRGTAWDRVGQRAYYLYIYPFCTVCKNS